MEIITYKRLRQLKRRLNKLQGKEIWLSDKDKKKFYVRLKKKRGRT